MVQTNGRADLVGSPIQLGDFLPERREVVLNGQKYLAWVVTNRRFPRSVQAQLDQARNRYMRTVAPLLSARASEDASDAAERQRALDAADVAYARYVTDALIALVPGLGEQEADMIDPEGANTLLTELGYLQPVATPDEPAAEGRGDADPLTGGSSVPDSRATTRRVGRKRR